MPVPVMHSPALWISLFVDFLAHNLGSRTGARGQSSVFSLRSCSLQITLVGYRLSLEGSHKSPQFWTSNQQPTTSNQQPTTSNQQPTTSNQREQATVLRTTDNSLLRSTDCWTTAPVAFFPSLVSFLSQDDYAHCCLPHLHLHYSFNSFATTMMDPMANLDGGGAPGASKDDINSKEVFDPIALNMNLKRIDQIRSFMGIVSGCVAGICGLTGLEGLVCFVVLHLFVAITIWAFKLNFKLKAYTRQNWIGFLTTNVQQCALSFMLFWTLFYGLVYLF